MIYSFLIHAVVAIGTALGIYSLPHAPVANLPVKTVDLGVAVQPIAGTTYTLSGSGLSSSATSIVLSSLTIPQTGQKIQDSDLSDTFYVTIEPGNRTRQEVSSCTTVVQNSNGTATLSGCSRGLAPITPYTASTTLQFAHSGGASLIFSDPPQLFNQYPAKANDETITGTWTFTNFPVTPSNTPATETVLGTVELATGAEAAATTLSGTVGRLALPTSISTSTYNAQTAPNVVVVTKTNGTIDSSFLGTTTISLSANLNLSGTATSTIASTTLYATTTTGTWTKPSNLKYIRVRAVGGGGDTGSGADGGAGGGGAYCERIIPAAAVPSTVLVTIGAAGSAGAGGNTTFGSLCTANGGSRGTTDPGSGNQTAGTSGGTVSSNGDINIAGEDSGAQGRGSPVSAVSGGRPLLWTYGRGASGIGSVTDSGGLPATQGIVIIESVFY